MLEHRRIDLDGSIVHAVEGGPASAPAIVFLHGWPQSWAAFEPVMRALERDAHVVAIDLPGIGGSTTPPRSNDKRTLAGYVHRAIDQLGLRGVTLVGHDAGGMITYAYLRAYPGALARAAILNVVIPGIEPWSKVIANPMIWHFAFHAVPGLPESLVRGREAEYFDYFFDAIAADRDAISGAARAIYAAAYARPEALRTGFEWYRAFAQDVKDNAVSRGRALDTPVLYLRGDRDGGDLETYVREFHAAGLHGLRGERIASCGHFLPDEQPAALAAALRRFVGLPH
jgi:pimeloyl-ACP methyl ester carboxylesterase